MRRHALSATVFVALIVAVMLIGGGVASAYWWSGGSGSGSATSGTTTSLTIAPGTPSNGLWPGAARDVTVIVSNPNTAPIVVRTLALDGTQGAGGYGVDSAHSAGCPVTALTYSSQSNGGSGWTIPARVGATNGARTIVLTDALALALSAPNGCQGASFVVYLAARP